MKIEIKGIPDTADISTLIRNMDSALVKSGISPVDCSPVYYVDSGITVTLDMATEFYLGIYRAINDISGTCWLQYSDSGWTIAIKGFCLCVDAEQKPRFVAGRSTHFKTKEDALKKFTEWTLSNEGGTR